MAEGDRPDDMPPSGKNEKPRRHPPVIELEATEVGDDGKPQPKPKPEQPESKQPSNSSMNARTFIPALVAGGVGALAGAAALYFLLPYFSPQPGGSADAALTREIASLSARIEAMSKQSPANPETAALSQRIDKLTSAIAETEKKLTEKRSEGSTAVAQPDPALEATSKELREALAELKKLGGQGDQPAVTAAIESLSSRIAALDTRMSSLAAASRSSVSSELAKEMSALNALTAAINSGKPFSQELGAARAAIGSKAAALEFLDQTAARGIPTVSNLAAQFTALVPKLLHKKEEGSGFLSRLYSNATNLVQVRKIGEPQGDDPESVLARIETQLARGDLDAALSETAKFPDSVKSDAAAWITEANKRRAAELAVKKLMDAALAAPEQPKS